MLIEPSFAVSKSVSDTDVKEVSALKSLDAARKEFGKRWGDVHAVSGDGVKAIPSVATFVRRADSDINANLYRNLTDLKLLTAEIAMHLSSSERNSIFKALNRLLDVKNWDNESNLIDTSAFRSYLRFIIFSRPTRTANMGVGKNGTLLAAWRRNSNQVAHIEFFPEDRCLAVVSASFVRGPETFVWKGPVARLRNALHDIGVGECLDINKNELGGGEIEEELQTSGRPRARRALLPLPEDRTRHTD